MSDSTLGDLLHHRPRPQPLKGHWRLIRSIDHNKNQCGRRRRWGIYAEATLQKLIIFIDSAFNCLATGLQCLHFFIGFRLSIKSSGAKAAAYLLNKSCMHTHTYKIENAHKCQGQKVNRLSQRDWGTWCPKVWQTGIIYLISCGISDINIFVSVQFRGITALCNIWCWTFIKFYPTVKYRNICNILQHKLTEMGTASDMCTHTYRPLTQGHESNTVKQGRSHGCARVCRCHPQWQLAHLKTDAE